MKAGPDSRCHAAFGRPAFDADRTSFRRAGIGGTAGTPAFQGASRSCGQGMIEGGSSLAIIHDPNVVMMTIARMFSASPARAMSSTRTRPVE